MTFADEEAVKAWQSAKYAHGSWTDWGEEGWFTNGIEEPVAVSDQIATFRALHDPKRTSYLTLDENGSTIELLFETGEDEFRANVADLAALLRSGATHGATGEFWFVGTAGAEYDFAYRLQLANGDSKLDALEKPDIAAVYDGDAYQRFMNRVMKGLGFARVGDDLARSGTLAAQAAHPKPAKPKTPTRKAARKPAAKSAPKKKPAAKKPVAKKPATKQAAKKRRR